MNNFFNYIKKAQGGLPVQRIIIFFLFFIVLIILVSGPIGQLFTSYQVLQVEGAEQECRSVGFQQYRQVYCEESEFDRLPENSRYRCDSSSQEFELYQDVKLYIEKESRCKSIEDEHCTCVMNAYLDQKDKAFEEIKELEKPPNSIGGIIGEGEIREEQSRVSDNSFNEMLVELSKEHDIELAKLQAFVEIESKGNPFLGNDHPTVRFECHIYNDPNRGEDFPLQSSPRVPCTIDEESGFSTITHETNYQAFKSAYNDNSQRAIYSSSFGVGQVMGFNYKRAGYSSIDEFYEAMSSEAEQVRAMLNFILTDSTLLRELQSSNTNWETVAYRYNGVNYMKNNYHNQLRENYQRFSSTS
ncbi:MAG: N-acetylmuramidase domain-containing protein [Candidatus Woesearchaeota archaeon]